MEKLIPEWFKAKKEREGASLGNGTDWFAIRTSTFFLISVIEMTYMA